MIILLQRKRVIEQYTNEIYYLHLSLDFSEKNKYNRRNRRISVFTT